MTVEVWRVTTERFADSSFSGEGARLYGGRWNPKGLALVYTAQTQSLALLEMLVQDSPLRARYIMIPARIPESLIERVEVASLPPDWRDLEARTGLQEIGATWARKRTSAVLAVPSSVVPAETNYLLNPNHPDFTRIENGSEDEWETDLRLLSRAAKKDA
jgi:RES domain-containing protein